MNKINYLLSLLTAVTLNQLKAEVLIKNTSNNETMLYSCKGDLQPDRLGLNSEYIQNLLNLGFSEYSDGQFSRGVLKEDVSYYAKWIDMASVQTEKKWIGAASFVLNPLFNLSNGLNSISNSFSVNKWKKNVNNDFLQAKSVLTVCENDEHYKNEISLPVYVFERIKNYSVSPTQTYNYIKRSFLTNSAIFSIPAWNQNGLGIIGSHDSGIYLMNQAGYLIKRIATGFWVHATPQVLRNQNFVIGSYDSQIYVINQNGDVLQKLKTGGHLYSTPIETKRGDLLVADEQGIVFLFKRESENLFNETPVVFFKAQQMIHTKVVELMNGDYLISSVDHTINRVDKNGKLKFVFKSNGPNLHSEGLETKDGLIYIGSYDGYVYILNPQLELKAKISIGNYVQGAVAQLSENQFAVGSTSGEIVVFDSQGTKIRSIKTKGRVVTNPLKLYDGSLVFGSFDGNLYKLNANAQLDKIIPIGTKIWSSLTYTPDKKSIVVSGFNGRVYFLNPDVFN